MSLFAIADTHLSFSSDKPMSIFSGWENFEEKLKKNWNSIVTPDDTVVIAGDITWAMNIEDAYEDFQFLQNLNGIKIIMKGNHDYWWSTKSKVEKFLMKNGFDTIKILFNNAYRVGDIAICGTRGWFFDCEKTEDRKVLLREAGRLKLSIDAAKKLGGEIIAFLHYPPISLNQKCDEIYDLLVEENVSRCYYGHLHAQSVNWAFNGNSDGVEFRLISADYLAFCPQLISKF